MASGKVEVDSSCVIQLIQQFLKESGYKNALATLQDESQLSVNTVDNMENFTNMILNGDWDIVLPSIASLKLPQTKLMDLYEHIIIELTEMREMATARAILRQTLPMTLLKQQQPDRYLRLEHLVARSTFIAADAYPDGLTKQQRRAQIAQSLSEEVTVVPPARLVSLLQQAIKWQQHKGVVTEGTNFDLFRGSSSTLQTNTKEIFPTRVEKIIQFVEGSNAECAAFSPDGEVLVTGSPDGFLEVWCYTTGKLKRDLEYQKEDRFMMHDSAILAVTFSNDSELIASGDQDGCIKIWQIKTGKCIRKFGQGHGKGVTSLRFHGTQIVSTSFDNTVRIHGIKSGKSLNIFRGHASFVNSVCFLGFGVRSSSSSSSSSSSFSSSSSGGFVVSGSSDGTVKIWDSKTHECLNTFRPTQQLSTKEEKEKRGDAIVPINCVIPYPRRPDSLIVCTKSPLVYVMTTAGVVTKTFGCDDPNVNFTGCVLSPKGEWLYCSGNDQKIYCFSIKSGGLEHKLDAHESEIVGLAHHPHQNLLASFSVSGALKLWKP